MVQADPQPTAVSSGNLTRRWSLPTVRRLGGRDSGCVQAAFDADPVASCMVASRVQEHGVDGRFVGGELWSCGRPEESLCFSGANLVPLRGEREDVAAFADRATRRSRVCSSIVGRQELALPLWEILSAGWGPPRDVRPDQPLLASREPSALRPDPFVRQVRLDELDSYLSAAVAMFIEEVGVDPRAGDGGSSYRRRVANLIASGRAWARFDDGRVVFKAEIGSVSKAVGQIQGVWVDPSRRGHGVGAAGTATVVNVVVASGRTASLYVNSYNDAARRVYAKVGLRQIATFATVLLD